MKKLFLMFIMFLFINQVSAQSLEEQLIELRNNINDLETKVNDNEKNRLDKTYPIGSIYETTTYSTASEVNSALGGTWERYGNGKTIVGVDESNENFKIPNKVGGTEEIILKLENLPSHSHSIPELTGTAKAGSTAATGGNHTHSIPAFTGTTSTNGSHVHDSWTNLNADTTFEKGFSALSSAGYSWIAAGSKGKKIWITESAGSHSHTFSIAANTTGSSGSHTHSVTTNASTSGSVGSGTSFTNLQPYITVYRYKRIA